MCRTCTMNPFDKRNLIPSLKVIFRQALRAMKPLKHQKAENMNKRDWIQVD